MKLHATITYLVTHVGASPPPPTSAVELWLGHHCCLVLRVELPTILAARARFEGEDAGGLVTGIMLRVRNF